jgi:hypothetical protein
MVNKVSDIGCLDPEFKAPESCPPLTCAFRGKVNLIIDQPLTQDLFGDINTDHVIEMQ